MTLEKLEARTLCDNGRCGNIAEYSVAKEGTPLNMRLHLCKDCIIGLYKLFGALAASEPIKKEV